MNFSFFSIADLLSFTQGVLLGVLFLSNTKGSRYANILLGLFILIFNFGSLHSFFLNSGLVDQYLWLLGFPSLFVFWFGPLLYFYTKSLTTSNFTWKPAYNWWFIPAVIEFIFNLVLLTLDTAQLLALAVSDPFTWGTGFYSFAASIFSIILVAKAQRSIATAKSLSPVKLKWLKVLLLYFMLRFILWSLYFALALPLTPFFEVSYYTPAVSSFFAVMDFIAVFAISIFSFRHMHAMHIRQKEAGYILSTAQEELYFNNLLRLMQEEKFYRQCDLKLTDVAAKLNTNVKYVSQLIRTRTDSSFTTFINTYRINEVKHRIVDEKSGHLTLIAIAEECGFNSKATFNRVFKEMTGASPKAFKEKHLQQF